MFAKGSFLRNLGGLGAPPTPPKTPSSSLRTASEDDFVDDYISSPTSGRYFPPPLSPQNSNISSGSSIHPPLGPHKENEDERTARRRPRRPNGSNGNIPRMPSNNDTQASFRQSIASIDAGHIKTMREVARQRRLALQQTESSIADTNDEDEDDGPPPVPQKNLPDPDPVNPADSLPTPPLDDPPATKPAADDTNKDHAEDIMALENLLNESSAELQASKDHAKKLKAQHDAEKRALFERIRELEMENAANDDNIRSLNRRLDHSHQEILTLKSKNQNLQDENRSKAQTIQDLEATERKTQSAMSVLTKEKQTWQQKLDGMHNRLHHAERQLRCLDHVTRAKLESRQSGIVADIKRNPVFAPKALGNEILTQINSLNAWIQPTAQLMSKYLVRSVMARSLVSTSRSIEVLGEGTLGLLQVHASQGNLRLDFLQSTIEMFMVHWATTIIEAWYPKQQSFADILADLSSQKQNARFGTRIQCGAPVKVLSTFVPASNFGNWALDIQRDLDNILSVADAVVPGASRPSVLQYFTTLAQKAYDLRTSLAERDLCGNIELSHISPDTLFQTKYMEDVHATPRLFKGAASLIDAERVAGTCRLGLQIPGTAGASAVLALKPKVVLLSKLNAIL